MDRYEVQSWVCDYGIYDNVARKFIGDPIDFYKDAIIICKWYNKLMSDTQDGGQEG